MPAKIRLLAGAACLIVTATAASAEPLVYGKIHLTLNYLDDGAEYSAINLASNSSRIGFRANHEFSSTLRGMIQLEGAVTPNSNNATSLTSRDSYAALMGDWGMVRAGYFNTPVKIASRRVELFGDQMGDSRNIVRGDYGANQGFDERLRNGVAYRSPSARGFTLDLHYSPETQSGTNAEDGNTNSAVSGALTYLQGPAFVSLGHERWSFEDASRERDITRLSGYYDWTNFRVTALAQTVTNPDDTTYGIGLRYQLTPEVFLKTQYYRLEADDDALSAELLALGADYFYAKNLRFYLIYAQLGNDQQQALAPWITASSLSQPGAANETASGTALGLDYSF